VLEGELAPGVRVQYVFETGDGGVLDILLGEETGTFDTVLRIYDTDGNLLAENDDINADVRNSGFEALEVPADMTLVIEAATYEDAGSGAFTLEIKAAEAE